MGGSRPWTLGRAASLAVVLAAALGILTGLTHVGQAGKTTSCKGDWQVVVGTAVDAVNAATANSRASQFIPTPCAGAEKDPRTGTYYALATFPSQQTAQQYADALVTAGYSKAYGVQPRVRPAPTTLTPTP